MLEPKSLGRGRPPNEGFDMGRRSGGGDILKHSSSEGVDALEEIPAPNRKGGSSLRALETVFVE